jgi:hypothetical protein
MNTKSRVYHKMNVVVTVCDLRQSAEAAEVAEAFQFEPLD